MQAGDSSSKPSVAEEANPDNAAPSVRTVRTYNAFVGNVARNATADDVSAAFAKVGEVDHVRMVTDRATGNSKLSPPVAKGFFFLCDFSVAHVRAFEGVSVSWLSRLVKDSKMQLRMCITSKCW